MNQFTARFRGAPRPLSGPVSGAYKGTRLVCGHDTPVSDQVSDNGTEHSGISALVQDG